MRYASGFSVPDPFILLDTGRQRHLLLSQLEYARAKRAFARKPRYKIILLDPLYEKVKRRLRAKKGEKVRKGSVLAKIAAAYLQSLGIRTVVVSPRMWVAHVAQLKRAGIAVTPSPTPLYPERAVKTKREVLEITKVRNATISALNRCLDILKQSKDQRKELVYKGKKVSSEFLRREARHILLDHACEAKELIISHGRQTAYPHDLGSGTIKVGEPIILDFFPRSMATDYWFDMTRTVCKGAPSPELRKLYRTVKKAQDATLAKVKAGVTTGAVHEAAVQVFERAGYKTTDEEGFIHSTGHGVGLNIHEAPSLHEKGTERLQSGMVLTVEPGLYYKNIGGVRLENTVMVTATGYKDLTRKERVLRL